MVQFSVSRFSQRATEQSLPRIRITLDYLADYHIDGAFEFSIPRSSCILNNHLIDPLSY